MNTEDTIIFTIGRMNPPTSGHMLLIEKMIEKALELNLTQIHIILSASEDNKKNPLSCDEKRNLLHTSDSTTKGIIDKLKETMIDYEVNKIENIKINIVCMNDVVDEKYGKHPIMKSIYSILGEIYNYPRDNMKMLLFIGEDRIDDYNWIAKELNEKTPSVAVEMIGLDRPPGAISATFIRNLAVEGNKTDFTEYMLQTGLDESAIIDLYDKIRTKINYNSQPRKRARKGGRRTYKKTYAKSTNNRKNRIRNENNKNKTKKK